MSAISFSDNYIKAIANMILADAKYIQITANQKTAVVPITSKYIEDNNIINLSYKLTSDLRLGQFSSMDLVLLSDKSISGTDAAMTVSYTQEIPTVDLDASSTIILMSWEISLNSIINSGGNQ